MSAHTPGPWTHVEKFDRRHKYVPVMSANNDALVATAPTNRLYWDEALSNARLIAAAPDLLAELKHIVRLLEPREQASGLSIPGLATLNAARAAIAKAEGRE